MSDSKIEWTGKTWNPTRGCVKLSAGCKRCYAEAFAERWRGVRGHAYEQGFDPREAPSQLAAPLSWRSAARKRLAAGKSPLLVFVNSMSDLFLETFSDKYRAAVYGVMAACPEIQFQVLTKRPAEMVRWYEWAARSPRWTPTSMCWQHAHGVGSIRDQPSSVGLTELPPWPLPNVWTGTTVENIKHGKPRIAELRKVPAAVRFISFEPLLEGLGDLDLTGIHWAIAGAESGSGARTMDHAWVRRIRDQCIEQGVRFFFKQDYRSTDGTKRRRKVSLPLLDGRRWAEYPEVR